MKLHASIYNSPILTEGVFENVYIEETKFEVKREDKYFAITFEMYCFKNEQRVLLATFPLAFLGMNDDPVNSNKKTLIQFEIEGEPVQVGMIEYMINNGGQLPQNYTIIDWGFPTYEDVLPNFDGGTLTNPELTLNNDFAKGWLLNNVDMKGEKVGVQFQFVE